MKGRFKGRKQCAVAGSLTVEAAGVMAVTLLAVATMLQASCRLHDGTVGAMVLHEMVETARHEKELDPAEAARLAKGHMKLLFADGSMELKNGGNALQGHTIQGKAKAGSWEKEIEGQCFRPETFMRRITLLEQLGEHDGDTL